MVKIYKQPFAHEGDTIAIPDVSQPDGKMSSADGWTVDYQLPSDDPNYKPVDRQEMNGVFKEVTEALGQVQVQGSATWSAEGAPYPVNAQVYHNGKQWIALRANSVVPTEGEDWSQLGTAATKNIGDSAGTVAAGDDSRITGAVQKSALAQSTGSSETNAMSQKSTTDDLATKANTSTQVVAGAGLAGGGSLAANRTLSIAASHTPLGVGQTWQNVIASRAKSTTYTNSTGRPIHVSVTHFSATGDDELSFAINGITVNSPLNLSGESLTIYSFLIPHGNSYRISFSRGALMSWLELR